jgi:two-component system phosphate regulon sensor histidine kinase PhoR
MTSTQESGAKTRRLAVPELTTVLDHLPAGVIVLGDERAIRYCNLAARRVVHPEPLVYGAPLPELGWEPPLEQVVARLFRHGTVAEQELSGGDRTFAVEGAVTRGMGILRIADVSARARQLRAEQDFVVNAAHEILSPLSAIAGAAHVLQESAKDDPQNRDRFIAHIVAATDRLVSVATALLVLARAESGVEAPRLELVPIRPLLEEVRRQWTDVSVSCPDSVAVLADPDLARQALATLLDNARRHSRDDVEIVVEEVDAMIAIEIADRGSGILPEHLERVTDRFFSGGGRDSGGYGVGLSIAARVANVLGGTLDFRSTRSGTRARLELPSARLL